MVSLPWTKLQDFYLRLGFLKVLVAALSPERRSIFGDALLRRLENPLFAPASSVPRLWSRIGTTITWYERDHARGEKLDQPSVAEAQLVAADHPSFLYGITKKSAIKIIDWGHDVGLMGAGHQITERGLIVRSHIPTNELNLFFQGIPEAWNPFSLSLSEKILFLYHLCETDHVLLEMASSVGEWQEARAMEAADASKLLCKALVRVLSRVKDTVRPIEVPAYKVATDLARTICQELDLQSELNASGLGSATAAVPRLPPTKKKIGAKLEGGARRVGTKSADHQTIPRVEQLVDLGFLSKPPLEAPGSSRDAKRRWRYAPTDVAHRWYAARARVPAPNSKFLQDGFARVVMMAHGTGAANAENVRDVAVIGRYFMGAYLCVGRRHGNSPLDSIALQGMVSAAVEGRAIEMADFERLMFVIKKLNVAPDDAFFAGGNDLETMFVRLKSKFLDFLEAKKMQVQIAYDEVARK